MRNSFGRAHRVRRLFIPDGIDRSSAVWLALMSLMLFILMLPVTSFVAALGFIKDEWSLNNTQSGAIYSAYLVGYALSALFVIPLTDRLGPKHILVGSAFVSVAAHLLFPLLADNTVSGALIRAFAGAGLAGVYMPGVRVIVARISGVGRGAAIGLFVTAFYAASSGSLAITGALMTSLSWRSAYLVVALVAVASLPLAYRLMRFQDGEPDRGSSGRLDLSVLGDPSIRYLILGYSLHVVQEHAVRAWLPGFLLAVLLARGTESAQAVATAATVAGVALLVGSVGPVVGGSISDRLGRTASASGILALGGACAWVIGWTGSLPLALIAFIGVVYGLSDSALSPIYTAGITEVANPVQLGSTMAVQAFLGFMGGVAGPIVFGASLDLLPDAFQWGIGFSGIGALSIVALAGMQRLRSIPQSKLLVRNKN